MYVCSAARVVVVVALLCRKRGLREKGVLPLSIIYITHTHTPRHTRAQAHARQRQARERCVRTKEGARLMNRRPAKEECIAQEDEREKSSRMWIRPPSYIYASGNAREITNSFCVYENRGYTFFFTLIYTSIYIRSKKRTYVNFRYWIICKICAHVSPCFTIWLRGPVHCSTFLRAARIFFLIHKS